MDRLTHNFRLFLAGLILLTLVGLCVHRADAADISGSFTYPTQFEDGTPLSLSQIAAVRVEYGSCAGSAFGTKAGEVSVTPPTTAFTITGLAPGTYCLRAYTRTVAAAGGLDSAPTGVVSKVIPFPPPKPPVFVTVAVIAGMLQVPVYSISANGKLSTLMGFIDAGKACAEPILLTYRGSAFREVSRADVKWWGSTTLRVAAPCAVVG